jgi:ABC-type glycerol-3-phosphate transport system permease component
MLVTLPLVKPALVPTVWLGVVWTFKQFNIIYLVSGGAPDNATDIDGASRAAIFFRLVLPLSRPALAVTALFSFMTAWNEYVLAVNGRVFGSRRGRPN